MLTTSFRSLRAITGMAKHGAYRRTQHSWQILLRSYVSTTRRTAASLLWGLLFLNTQSSAEALSRHRRRAAEWLKSCIHRNAISISETGRFLTVSVHMESAFCAHRKHADSWRFAAKNRAACAHGAGDDRRERRRELRKMAKNPNKSTFGHNPL